MSPTVHRIGREYLRVSRDHSGREHSQDQQHAGNVEAAAAQGYTLGEPYRERGSASASRHSRKTRDAFTELLSDLDKGTFDADVLILWESSRGSRKVGEWVTLIEACEQNQVCIFVTTHNREYDPANPRDRRSLLDDAVDSEYESAKIRERARRDQLFRAAAGDPHGRVPFGYRRVHDARTGKLVAQEPDPDEAPVVKELFDRLNKGHSLRSIAADFERRGIQGKSGKALSPRRLRALALSRAYIGERVHDPGRKTTTLSDKATYTKAAWKPLVNRATFLAVQQILTAPERTTRRPGRAVHLLSMIATCDVCGGPLSARTSRDGQQHLRYQCHKSGHVLVAAEDLDDLATAVMLGYLSRKDNTQALLADDNADDKLQEARDEVADIAQELDELASQLGSGAISAGLAAKAEPGILKRLKVAQEREQQLSTPSILRGLITPGAGVARRWRATPMEAKREIARILLSRAIIGELRVTRSASAGHRSPVQDRVTFKK